MSENGEGLIPVQNSLELPMGFEKQRQKYLEIKKDVDRINEVSLVISEKFSNISEVDQALLNDFFSLKTGIEPMSDELQELIKPFEEKYADLLCDSVVVNAISEISEINKNLIGSLNDEVWNELEDKGKNFSSSIGYDRIFIELQKTDGNNFVWGSVQDVCVFDINEMDTIGKSPQSSGFENGYSYVRQMEKLSELYKKYKPFVVQPMTTQNELSEAEIDFLEQSAVHKEASYIQTKTYTILGAPAGEISQLSLGTRFERVLFSPDKRNNVIQHPNLARTIIKWIQEEPKLSSESPLTSGIQMQIYEKIKTEKIQPENEEKNKSQEQLVVEGIVERYKEMIGGDLNHRDIINSDIDRKFIDSVVEIFADNRFSLIELRLLQSDLMALYYVAVGGGDAKLIQDWENKSGQKFIELSLGQQKELFANLQNEFFKIYRNRTKEIDFVNSGLDLPSIGMELEHQELINNLMVEYSNLLLFEKILLGEENIASLDRLDIKVIEKIMVNFGEFIGMRGKHSYLQILEYIKLDNSENLQIKNQFRTYITEFKEKIRNILGIKLEEKEDQQLKNILEAKKQTNIRMMDLNPVMPWKEYWDRTYPEYAGHPVLDPITAMREQYLMIKSGLLQNADTVHFTVSGDLLNPDDMEFFETRMLLDGAAYLNSPVSPERYEMFDFSRLEESYGEKFIKASKIEGKYYVIPFHRVRQLKKGNQSAFDLMSYSNKDEFAVEFRSFDQIAIDTKNIRSYARSGTFIWLAAVGKRYSKVPAENRTPQQQEIAKSWENLMFKWKALKDSEKIKTPNANELCVDVSDEYLFALQNEDYVRANKITRDASRFANIYMLNISKSSANQEFKNKCRKLIFEYSNSVKRTLGL